MIDKIETENWIAEIIKEKIETSCLEGDCYLGILYLRMSSPENFSEMAEHINEMFQRMFDDLKITARVVILPQFTDENRFVLYGLNQK